MKHSLFTKLMSLFLAFALLVPCFPQAYAGEITEITESTEAPEADISTEAVTTGATETSEAAEITEATETTAVPEVTEATEETLPATETTLPAEETVPSAETVPTEEPIPTEETVPEEETQPEVPAFLPLGMPEGYVLREQNEKDRLENLDHGVLNTLYSLTPGEDYAYGEILVLAESEEEARLMADAFCGTLEFYYDGLATILLGEATVPQAVEASLSGEYNLPVATPNYITRIEPEISTPISPYAVQAPTEMTWSDWVQVAMDNPDPALETPSSYDYQYHHDVIDTYAAWGVTTGKNSVTVAVIDTGVQSSHPDLNVTEYSVPTVNLTGYSDGHGTHVCGIIAATMNNGLGGAGIAPYINLQSYRITTSSGEMSDDAIYYAIRQAAQNGADVINMSFGGPFYSSVIQNAINYAANVYGATLVAAMGNDGSNSVCYPAACDNVIAVAATDQSNRRAWFSNYGAWCDISAPGMDIYSTYPGSDYTWLDGTSQAAPVVTGAIALYLSFHGVNPGPSTAYIEKLLKSSATKCADTGMGAGIVNISNMLDHKPEAPVFSLLYNGSTLYDIDRYDGSTVPCETKVHFYTLGADQSWYILYTLNGKTPSVKNGQVVAGTVVNGDIDLSPYAGTTVTLKAMQVSGMGIPGKVMTKKIKVAESTYVSSVSITGPSTIVAGKSGQFSATVNPVSTANQDVNWSIVSYTDVSLASAKISQKGVLTTPKNSYGSVTIRATSLADSNKTTTYKVNVRTILPVTKVTLNRTSGTLYIGKTLSLSAVMTDKNGTTVTTAGKLWTSSNTNVATVSSSGVVTAISKGKATITCKALDGSGKTAKCTITVNQQVTGITITGNTAVAPGSSTSLKAVITPSTANNKGVTWSKVSGPSGVTVSASGSVKVPSYVSSGTITVRAIAKDGQGASATYTLTIQKKITGMTLSPRSSYTGWAEGFTYKNGNLHTVNLFSVDLNESSGQDNYCALKSTTYGASVGITWTSSNPAVASVSGNGYVTAHKAGTAKITCTPLDGSKKTASVTVKVTNPVSYMGIKTNAPQMSNDMPYIGFGKSVTNSVVFGDTYGTPSNKKVEWDYRVYIYNQSEGTYSNVTSTFKNKNLVTVSSSGKVSVSSKVWDEWGDISSNCEFNLDLYAYSTDGTDAYGYKEFLLVPPCTKIEMIEAKKFYTTRNSYGCVCFASNQWHPFSNEYNSGFIATSSNPQVCSVGQVAYGHDLSILPCEHYSSGSMNCYDLHIYSGNKKGTATITIKATDGSNKTCKFTVVVQ